MGAIYIRGINNWRKIQAHKNAYLNEGNLDWSAEFRRFTAKAENYKDTVIVVSKRNYSALPAEETIYSEEEWLCHSLTIRIYHELTHLVYRGLYPGEKDVLWDEITADCIGICKALGHYDPLLAQKVSGIEKSGYRQGGRLENYVENRELLSEYCDTAKNMIHRIGQKIGSREISEVWDVLSQIHSWLTA